jgi:quercetin dioxygenase-like cupin family protein
MKSIDVTASAAAAIAANPTRPASAVVLDSADARLVVFRIGAGQAVAPHVSPSSVVLLIAAGAGLVVGNEGERAVTAGDVVSYEPNERHGMRAEERELVVLAIIAPRPGERH